MIEIWQPRYRDKVVLIPTWKIQAENHIVFTKTTSYPGTYFVSGENARECPVEDIKGTKMYAIPMNKLTKEG